MREIDRVTANGKTSLGMAFKTESAQSSWLPDQVLKKGGDIWRNWREMGLSLPLAREKSDATHGALPAVDVPAAAAEDPDGNLPIAEIVNGTLQPRSNSAD